LSKVKGRELSWEIFYRILGVDVQTYPLWKAIPAETVNYSRTQFVTDSVSDELLGTPGNSSYSGQLLRYPIAPGALRIKVDGMSFRDNNDKLSSGYGTLITPDNSTGTINYATGKYTIELENPATTNILADYEAITTAYPYRAARVELELFLYQGGPTPMPFDQELIDRVLSRLEEVRPIHVLIQTFIVVLDVEDTLPDFCSDAVCCGPHKAKDVRSNEYRFYAADLGPNVNDELLRVEKDFGATKELNAIQEDHCPFVMNPDLLTIEFSDGQPTQYW